MLPQQLGLETTYLNLPGLRMHVVVAGPQDGLPVVLLHGFPEFWYGWRQQITPLAAAGYRVIVPDQRGYNLTEKPKGVAAYRLEALTNDIVALLDALGYAQCALIGHDWGAAVAWSVALTHPQRITRLGILNVPHPVVFLRTLRGDVRQMLKSWYIGFFQIPALADWSLSRNNFANLARLLIGSGQQGTFARADVEEYKRAWAQPSALTGMINWYRALLWHRPPAPPDIRLRLPVLMLWGQQDVALSSVMAQPSIDLCDHGRLILFENATHWVQHDEAPAVTAALLKFLGEN
jgi:pimeloyl-ACP methyl ester carboxylesterase